MSVTITPTENIVGTYPISMVGPRGVGKTSMLASIWSELDEVSQDLGVSVVPAIDTESELLDCLDAFEDIAARPAGDLPLAFGIDGSTKESEFRFTLSHAGTKSHAELVFRGFPEGWFDRTLREGTKNGDRVAECLRTSSVLMVAVDAPALMAEENPSIHAAVNRLRAIKTALSRSLQESSDPRLIIFSLLRSERWLCNNADDELIDRFE